MVEQLRPGELHLETDMQPVYNIKAVVEATGLPAATLRAWERRYGALAPQRSGSGYRLYSAQDITVLRWLKARVEAGMSISQAIALLGHQRRGEPAAVVTERRQQVRPGSGAAQSALLDAFTEFDEGRADAALEEAFALYGVETVFERIIAPAMAQIGALWHTGGASTAVEHFTSNYVRRKMEAMISASPKNSAGPLVVMGCAPEDWHELGLLLLYLLLRRRGLHTIYLGQNVPPEQFLEEMERLRPALVIISAATPHTVPGLIALAEAVQTMVPPRPVFAYGGQVFNAQPELRHVVPGVFLGESTRAAAEYVAALVRQGAASTGSSAAPAAGLG